MHTQHIEQKFESKQAISEQKTTEEKNANQTGKWVLPKLGNWHKLTHRHLGTYNAKQIIVIDVVTKKHTELKCEGVRNLFTLGHHHFASFTSDTLSIFEVTPTNEILLKQVLRIKNRFIEHESDRLSKAIKLFPNRKHLAIAQWYEFFSGYRCELQVWDLEKKTCITKDIKSSRIHILDDTHLVACMGRKAYLYSIDFNARFFAIKKMDSYKISCYWDIEPIANSPYLKGNMRRPDCHGDSIQLYTLQFPPHPPLKKCFEFDAKKIPLGCLSQEHGIYLSPDNLFYYFFVAYGWTELHCYNMQTEENVYLQRISSYNEILFPEKNCFALFDRGDNSVTHYTIKPSVNYAFVTDEILTSQRLNKPLISLITEYAFSPTLFKDKKSIDLVINERIDILTKLVKKLSESKEPNNAWIKQAKIDFDTLNYFKYLLSRPEESCLLKCIKQALEKFDNTASESMKAFLSTIVKNHHNQSEVTVFKTL